MGDTIHVEQRFSRSLPFFGADRVGAIAEFAAKVHSSLEAEGVRVLQRGSRTIENVEGVSWTFVLDFEVVELVEEETRVYEAGVIAGVVALAIAALLFAVSYNLVRSGPEIVEVLGQAPATALSLARVGLVGLLAVLAFLSFRKR